LLDQVDERADELIVYEDAGRRVTSASSPVGADPAVDVTAFAPTSPMRRGTFGLIMSQA